MAHDALRAELVAMLATDEAAVGAVYADADQHRAAFDAAHPHTATPWPYAIFEWTPADQAPPDVQWALTVVRRNTVRLRSIVADHGWPGRTLVGEDGATAAWLVLQHAGSKVATIGTPENHAFRRDCVPLLRAAVRAGEAHPRHLAHIVDGICMVEDRLPVYAVLSTAYTEGIDLDEVDLRRFEVGLPPVAGDLAARAAGRPIGPDSWEPWPPIEKTTQEPSTSNS